MQRDGGERREVQPERADQRGERRDDALGARDATPGPRHPARCEADRAETRRREAEPAGGVGQADGRRLVDQAPAERAQQVDDGGCPGELVVLTPGDRRQRDGLGGPRHGQGDPVEGEHRQTGEREQPRDVERGTQARGQAGAGDRGRGEERERQPRADGERPVAGDGGRSVRAGGDSSHDDVQRERHPRHLPVAGVHPVPACPAHEPGEADRRQRPADRPRRAVGDEPEGDVREDRAEREDEQAELARDAVGGVHPDARREVARGEGGEPDVRGGRGPDLVDEPVPRQPEDERRPDEEEHGRGPQRPGGDPQLVADGRRDAEAAERDEHEQAAGERRRGVVVADREQPLRRGGHGERHTEPAPAPAHDDRDPRSGGDPQQDEPAGPAERVARRGGQDGAHEPEPRHRAGVPAQGQARAERPDRRRKDDADERRQQVVRPDGEGDGEEEPGHAGPHGRQRRGRAGTLLQPDADPDEPTRAEPPEHTASRLVEPAAGDPEGEEEGEAGEHRRPAEPRQETAAEQLLPRHRRPAWPARRNRADGVRRGRGRGRSSRTWRRRDLDGRRSDDGDDGDDVRPDRALEAREAVLHGGEAIVGGLG